MFLKPANHTNMSFGCHFSIQHSTEYQTIYMLSFLSWKTVNNVTKLGCKEIMLHLKPSMVDYTCAELSNISDLFCNKVLTPFLISSDVQ